LGYHKQKVEGLHRYRSHRSLITMKTRTTILALLLPLVGVAAEPAATQGPPKIEEAILAAARVGDVAGIGRLIIQSFEQRGSLDEGSVKALLDDLVRSAELPAFTVLLGEMRKTNLGKNWQPDDPLLAELIRAGRTDFIDAMLASWLDPARLEAKRDAADSAMAEWLTRRVAEVRKQRAEHEELVAAAGKGDLETMHRLLDAGVDVNCVAEKSRHTPLTLAARESRLQAVRLLLERGATVDQPKHPGWDYTPLCLTKNVEIAELLKAYGANIHAKLFKRDVSILTYMVRFGGADIVEWMLKEGLDPKMIGDNKQNLLFAAGDARTAEILLAASVDPNAVDEFGRTPLQGAQKGVAEKLLAAGAKLPATEDAVAQMIGGFASADSVEAVIKGRGGIAPEAAQKALISAAHTDRDEIVKLLLAHGAKANELSFLGDSKDYSILPLMMCTVHGSPKTAKVLLAHGADPNGGDWPGILLQNAIQNGHHDVARILWDAGGRGVSELAFHIAMKDEKKVGELLKSAPAFAEQPEFWAKALPAAARLGQLEIVRAALARGVPLKESTAPGKTRGSDEEGAIYAAAAEGQHEVLVELLPHRGTSADPSDLRQPLWIAVWNSHPYERQRSAADFEKCVKLLLDAKAPVAVAENERNLVIAAVFTRYPGGNPNVVEMLATAGADPNPLMEKDKPQRLSDAIEISCAQQGCSTPFARTVAAIEKAAKITIKR
jgi:ankyrin repeat protein